FIKMPVVGNFGRTHRGTPHPAPTPRNNPDSLVDDFNVGGTITNPIQIIDSDDESRIVRVSDSEDDDEAMNEVINSVNAATIAHAAEHIIEGGQHGQPPEYTEPSYRDRVDQWLQAFSVMPPVQRSSSLRVKLGKMCRTVGDGYKVRDSLFGERTGRARNVDDLLGRDDISIRAGSSSAKTNPFSRRHSSNPSRRRRNQDVSHADTNAR
ncbi:hypothetical protein OC846_006949, partial [Tilletia horrida]